VPRSRALDEQAVELALLEIGARRRDVGLELRSRDVEQDELDLAAGLDLGHQALDRAPGGLERLEGGRVEQGPHLGTDRPIDRRDQIVLARIGCGHHVRSDESTHEAPDVFARASLDPRLREIRRRAPEQAADGFGIAFDAPGLRRGRRSVVVQLRRRERERGRLAESLARRA
jgi:hypothetical protein